MPLCATAVPLPTLAVPRSPPPLRLALASLLLAGAAPAGPRRKGRPLQAAQRRGRPARQDRPAEPVRRLQRQRRRHQGHDDDPGRRGSRCARRPTATTPRSRSARRRKPATFRQKRDGVDEYIEGEAERLEYDGKSDVVRFVNNASVRRLRGADGRPTRSPATSSPTTAPPRSSTSPAARRPTAANPGGRVRAVLTPQEGSAAAAEAARRPRRGRRAPRAAGSTPVARRTRQVSAAPPPRRRARTASRRTGLHKSYGCAHGRRRTCAWRSTAARSSACSARTAPARRRAST